MNVKIVVCYHKKDILYKSDILLPIHCGRAITSIPSKDGKVANSDQDWLNNVMIGDDTDDNISVSNRSLNEMTAIYWVWKNYDKIGNPDYIGLNHYRRFFDIPYSKLDKILGKYDLIKHRHYKSKDSYYTLWMKSFDKEFYNIALDIFRKINKVESEKFDKYMNTKVNGGLCNMFIMSKEEFFKYCEFIFPILLNLPIDEKYKRYPGMFAERLTSYYLYELSKNKLTYNSSIVGKPYKNMLEYYLTKIFSIKKHSFGKHYVITILGIKIKI